MSAANVKDKGNGFKASALALTATCLTVFLGACSTAPSHQIEIGNGLVASDPMENSNRKIFAFNRAVDNAVINPVIEGYRDVVPKPARTGLQNFLRNLKSPVTFANQLLQGDIGGAGDVLTRATINTLLGIGGLYDLAGHEGIAYESEDFGQTLAVWGVDHGPYMVVPFLGPSSVRDYTGYAVDSFADPLRWYLFNTDQDAIYYTKIGADYLTLREELIDVLKDLEESSIDYYASVRSIYYQRREAMTEDRAADAVHDSPAIPDYDEGEDDSL